MSTGGERLEGIKAYKGTIESAEQTLSFLITFICEGEEMCEEGNMHEETKDLVIPSNLQKKGERIVFYTPAPKVS